MDISVDFESDMFKPFLPEDSQVNPNVYGMELAFWLSKSLAMKNVITSYPEYEDWGWYLEYFSGGNEYMLCCSNLDKNGNQWRCHIRGQPTSFLNRNRAPIEMAKPLLDALKSVLEETEGISKIEWCDGCSA